MPTKERTATLVEDVSFTVRARVTVDGLDTAPDVGRNIRNIFSAMVAGSSGTDERETWFRERMELEIKATHPEVLYAEVLVCTSDDPTNHQGNTCPIHEDQTAEDAAERERTQTLEHYAFGHPGVPLGCTECK